MHTKTQITFLFVLLAVTLVHPRQWCFTKNKYYRRTIKVPQRVCRNVKPPLQSDVPSRPINSTSYSTTPKPPPPSPIRDNKITAKDMMKLFPGLFLDKETASKLNNQTRSGRGKVKPGIAKPGIAKPGIAKPGIAKPGIAKPGIAKPGIAKPGIAKPGIKPGIPKEERPGERPSISENHDGDLHCPTFRNLVQAPNVMVNVQRQSRDIVHFSSEGVFQFVHEGVCGSGSTQSCNKGACVQEKSIVYLMVWQNNADWLTGFEPFEVDSYCSCKGITL